MQSNELGLVLDALSSPLTILNNLGVIVYVNQAWKRFAGINNLGLENYGVGVNYLTYCEEAIVDQSYESITVAQGIRSVITGAQKEYSCQYPCHNPTEQRWFQMRVVPFDYEECRHAIVIHENITGSKASEKRLRNILEKAPIGMAIITLDGQFIEVNRALGEMLGYEKSDFLTLSCEQINHPDDFNSDEELMQELLQGKQSSYRIEKRFLRKDGEIAWVNLTCSLLRDESGTPVHIIKQIQDITEKINVDICLRSREHQLNVVLNNMPALIGYWNSNLVNEFGNKAYSEWFGIEPGNLKGMHLREVIGEHLYSLNLPYIENALRGEPQEFECIIVDTLGNDHYTLASYIPDIFEESVKGFFVLGTDITQIKKTEIELRRSKQLSRMLLSVSIDGFNFTDLNGRFLNVNSSFCQMLGYTEFEILNMSVSDIEFIENPEQTAEHIKKIAADGFDRFETIHRRKDGTLLDVEVSVAYLSDRKEFFAFTRDITQRKQTEKLRVKQLEQQRDTLVREVHHRIKNNLQGVIGVLRQFAESHMEVAEPLNQVISQMQSVAVIHGLQGHASTTNVRVCELTTAIAAGIKTLWQKPVIVDIPDCWVPCTIVKEEAVPLALILNELILNAVKHSAADNPVRIVLSHGSRHDSIILTIHNTGQIPVGFGLEGDTCFGTGLQLVTSLLPPTGTKLSWAQQGHTVVTTLDLDVPVIQLESITL